eukprot:tig00000076_g2366.t1
MERPAFVTLAPAMHAAALRTQFLGGSLARRARPIIAAQPRPSALRREFFVRADAANAQPPAAMQGTSSRNITLEAAEQPHPNQKQRRGVKPRDVLEVEIESLAFGGAGVARHEGLVVLVEGGAVPGDRLRVFVFAKKKGFAEARIEEVLRPGPARIAPPCPHFLEDCGGCKTQSVGYDEQVAQKTQQVKDLYQRQGGFDTSGIFEETLGCAPDNQFHYRNKMEFTVSRRRWIPRSVAGKEGGEAPEPAPGGPTTSTAPGGDAAAPQQQQEYIIGLHCKGRFDKILPIHSCLLQRSVPLPCPHPRAPPAPQDPLANEVLQFGTATARELNLEPYDIVEHTGYLRNFVIRTGTGADGARQMMVNLVTSEERPDLLAPLKERLLGRFPGQITTIVNNITASLSGVARGEREVVLHGPGTIEDTLRGVTFKHTYGFEIVESAVANARENAERNGIQNISFFQGDLSKLFSKTPDPEIQKLPHPDVLVTDPPRAGMVPKLIDHIVLLSPKRIVYVSCNPSTQVRDLQALCSQGGYRLTRVLPVDQFPHTGHVEVIAVLDR